MLFLEKASDSGAKGLWGQKDSRIGVGDGGHV